MKQTPVSELEGPLLAEFVAMAQPDKEFIFSKYGVALVNIMTTPYGEYRDEEDYRPDINGLQAMELVKKFNISFRTLTKYCSYKYEATVPLKIPEENAGVLNDIVTNCGETPEIAICRAVVASVYGEYVEV